MPTNLASVPGICVTIGSFVVTNTVAFGQHCYIKILLGQMGKEGGTLLQSPLKEILFFSPQRHSSQLLAKCCQ